MKKQFLSKSVPRGTRTIWRYLGALFILFTFAIGNVWAADNVFTFPTSGSITTQRSYSITGTGTACVDGNKIYHETNQSYSVGAAYGVEANKLGVAFKPTKDCQLAIKYGSNTASSRTITSNFYKAADPRLYQLFVDAADVSKGVSKYVLDNYTSDYSWWKDQGLIKYSSNKYQEDAGNGAKAMSGETTKTGLRTAWFTNTALTIAAQSSATKVIEAADTTVIFRANQEYFIYATRNSSGVGYMQFVFTPVYMVTLNLDGGSFAGTPEGWKISGGNYTKMTSSTTLPTPAKEGKDFDGWMNPSSEKVESPYAPSAAITLTAKWKDAAPRYAITYNKGEYGTGEIAGGEKIEGEAFTLSSDRFTRAGYVQTGWSLTDGGAKAYDLGGSYTTDEAKEFFPVWTETSTYVASFDSGEGCTASTPAGWTFANAGSYGAEVATADYECKFGSACPASGSAANASYIAFAKSASVYATYDLGAATTVAAVTGTFYVGSSSARTFTIDYLGADETTVLHTITVNHPSGSNWGADNVNETAVVDNVRYIKVKGMTSNQSWIVMSAFSVTYVDLVTKYNVTFDKNDAGASGSQTTLKYAEGAEVTLPGCTFTAPDNKEFDAWTSTDVTISNNKFTMPNKPVTIKATWKAIETKYAISEGTPANGTVDADLAEASAGATVTITATPATDYLFDAWDVYKTDESTTKVTVTETAGVYTFEMPGYAVTVSASFVADTRKKVLYVTTNAEDATKASDKLYAALKDIYNVSIVGYASEADQTAYDLVVLHESIGGGNYGATAVAAAKTGSTPVLNTKSFFYNDGRWGWGTPNAGQTVKGATLNSAYCNIANHPLFDGVTMTDGFFEITDEAAAKCMQPVGEFTTGKEGYTLATTPNDGEGNGCAIHELTPAQRGASAGKYLMISVSNAKLNALNANGQKLFQNAAAYLIGSTSWIPVTAPENVAITANDGADHKTGDNVTMTASAENVSATTTYAWFYGATLDEAQAAGAIQTAKTAAEGGNEYNIASCELSSAGKYWCVVRNAESCETAASFDLTVAQTYTVSYLPGDGTGATIVDGNATVVADCPGSFIAPTTGKMFYGWKDGDNNDVAVGAAVTSNLVLYAQWGDIMVAKIGDTMYPSLEAALLHAADGTIELLQDIDVTAQVEVLAGVTATIDLAGHKIEYVGASTLPSGVILVHNGASLTINDSSDPDAGSIVSGDNAYAAVALTKLGDDPSTPATLVVNGGALTGYYYGITGNGSRNNTDITINGGTITGTVGIAIYHPQVGTLTVNNGSLTGVDAAIEMRAGTLVINDGTFTATATVFSCDPNGSGSTTSGAAIAIAQHTTKKDIEVTINGGTFNGVKALNESNPQVNDPAPQVTMAVKDGNFVGEVSTVDVNHFISGGTFDHPVLNEQCAENFVPKDNGDDTYGVKPKDGVCIIKGNVGDDTFVIDEAASLFEGTADKNNVKSASSTYDEKIGWKFNSRPARLGLTLSGDETFQEGDVVEVFVTSVANISGANDKMRIFDANDATSSHMLVQSADDMIQGANRLVLPATTTKSLYLHRTKDADYDNFNPFVAYVAVYRPMMPKLMAITIDGRAGEINEAAKTVAVTIPYEADLAHLTIVPTVVRNAPHATTPEAVISNEGAWVIGANTYRVMDKDGDYTDYIITLTRDELKHTVSFNTHGGSAVASVLVVDGESLTAAPAAPTKEDYEFQGWAETADGAIVDVTSFTITADKEFHAVWAADGAIKLFDGEGNLNTTNFISPAKTTIEIADVEHVCLAEFNSNRSSSLAGATPTDMVKYDATTDEAKIKITFYNSNSGIKKAVLYKYEEGAEAPEKIEIEVPGQQIWTTEYYTFNSSKNRSFYVCMNDRSYIRVLQVKVVDNGANPVKQFGQVGYSLNLNKGRFYAKAAVEKSFEGFTFTPSSEYKVYNNSNLATTSANSFTIASPTVMSVKRSGGKYYVYQDPADKGTLYTADAEIELNATGTWYISSETTSSAASFTKIEFLAPKCQKPTIETQPATNHTFDPGDMTATVVATVSDGGTLHYQWYKKATVGDDEEVGTDAATLTTTTVGTYYVVVTNTLAGHQDVSVTSEEAELGYRVTNDATLMALSYGTPATAIALEDGVYNYNVELAKGTTDVPALAATATMDGYATVTISNAAEFVSYAASSTVTVKSEDATVTNVYTVNFTVKHDLPQVDVTATTTWDMTNVSASAINLANAPYSCQDTRLLLANIDGVNNNASFNSQALMFEGQHIGRTSNNVKHLAGRYVQFNVTVPGAVFVTFESNGDNARTISINGKKCSRTTSGTAADKYITYAMAVEPGSVEIIGYEGESANKYVRISKIEFKAEYSYHRENLNPSYLGTLCWTNNAILGGGTLYEFAGKDEYNKLVFDEVAENRLEAGKPYIFMPENGNTEIKVYNTDNEDALTEDQDPVNHMYGTITGKTLVPGVDDNMYYFSASHIWAVKDFTVNINIPAYCCYVDYVAVLNDSPAPAPAPGRRRVTMGVQGTQVATGMENLNVSDKPVKMIINGQLFILRGEKMYDAKGQLVK